MGLMIETEFDSLFFFLRRRRVPGGDWTLDTGFGGRLS